MRSTCAESTLKNLHQWDGVYKMLGWGFNIMGSGELKLSGDELILKVQTLQCGHKASDTVRVRIQFQSCMAQRQPMYNLLTSYYTNQNRGSYPGCTPAFYGEFYTCALLKHFCKIGVDTPYVLRTALSRVFGIAFWS